MNTHSYLYSLLERLGGGARGGALSTVVKFAVGVVYVEVTRKSVGTLFVVVVVVPSDSPVGKVGRMFGPLSISSTR